MKTLSDEPFPDIYVDAKEEGKTFDLIAQSQLKKLKKLWAADKRKSEQAAAREAEKEEQRKKNLEEDRAITISEDVTLPKAVQAKISHLEPLRGQRVKVYGWVHRLRKQGKNLMFIVLRDGNGFLQCVLNDKLCHTYEALVLSPESSVCIYGTVTPVPSGHDAPGGHELHADFWELVGLAPPGGAEAMLNEEANPDVQLDNRHIMIRGENVSLNFFCYNIFNISNVLLF